MFSRSAWCEPPLVLLLFCLPVQGVFRNALRQVIFKLAKKLYVEYLRQFSKNHYQTIISLSGVFFSSTVVNVSDSYISYKINVAFYCK